MARSTVRFGSESPFGLTQSSFLSSKHGPRLDLACSSARFARSPAQLKARHIAARLGSARYSGLGASRLVARARLGVEWRLGDQLNARLGSARSSARGSARGSARDWLGNRDSVWLGSGLSWAHLSRLGAWDRLGARLGLEARPSSMFDQHPFASPMPFSMFHPCGELALFSPNILRFFNNFFLKREVSSSRVFFYR